MEIFKYNANDLWQIYDVQHYHFLTKILNIHLLLWEYLMAYYIKHVDKFKMKIDKFNIQFCRRLKGIWWKKCIIFDLLNRIQWFFSLGIIFQKI